MSKFSDSEYFKKRNTVNETNNDKKQKSTSKTKKFSESDFVQKRAVYTDEAIDEYRNAVEQNNLASAQYRLRKLAQEKAISDYLSQATKQPGYAASTNMYNQYGEDGNGNYSPINQQAKERQQAQNGANLTNYIYMNPVIKSAEKAKNEAVKKEQENKGIVYPVNDQNGKNKVSVMDLATLGKSNETISSISEEDLVNSRKSEAAIQEANKKGRIDAAKDYWTLDTMSPTMSYGDTISTVLQSTGNPFRENPEQKYSLAGISAERIERYSNIANNDVSNPLRIAENSADQTSNEVRQYTFMTDAQKQHYNALYGVYGKDKAEAYHNMLLDEINQRIGNADYDEALKDSSTLGKTAYMGAQGLESGISGVLNTWDAFIGTNNAKANSISSYTASAIRNDENNNFFENMMYDSAQSIGNMLPGMVAGLASGGAGNLVFALSQYGNSYREAINGGENTSTAGAYALQQGIDEAATNAIMGGIAVFGGGALTKTLGDKGSQKLIQALDGAFKTPTGKKYAKAFIGALSNMAGEAAQEYVQYFTQNWTQALLGMKDENGNPVVANFDFLNKDALYSALLGAVDAGMINAATVTAGRAARSLNNNVNERYSEYLGLPADSYANADMAESAAELQGIRDYMQDKDAAGQKINFLDRYAQTIAEDELGSAIRQSYLNGDYMEDRQADTQQLEKQQAEQTLMNLASEVAADQMSEQQRQAEAIKAQARQNVQEQTANNVQQNTQQNVAQQEANAVNTEANTQQEKAVPYNVVNNTDDAKKTVIEALYGKEANNGENSSRTERQVSVGGYRLLTKDQQGQFRTQIQRTIQSFRNLSETESTERRSADLITDKTGRYKGTDKTVRVATEEFIKNNDWARKIVADNASQNIETILGFDDIEMEVKYTDESGNVEYSTEKARAYVSPDGKRIYINVANSIFTAEQLNAHERFHREIENDKSLLNAVKQKLQNYSDEDLMKLAEDYETAYRYMSDDSDPDYTFKEICCDLYADMAFPEGVTVQAEDFSAPKEALAESKERKANGTRGSPRFSKSRSERSDFNSLYTLDNGNVKINNADDLSIKDWQIIYKAVKKAGYDVNSAEQAKEVYSRYIKNYTFNEDQSKYILKGYGLAEEGKKETTVNTERIKKAKKYFGITNDFREAGYLLPDGYMLDFSGRKFGNTRGGNRAMDHREISPVFNDGEVSTKYGDGTPYMNAFISEGNIRIMDGQGVTIGETEPTAKQYAVLKRFIDKTLSDENFFYLDLSNNEGHTVESREYSEADNSSRIINEIKYYYKNEELPYRSELQGYRFSRDIEYNPMSVGEEESRNYAMLLESSPELRAAADKLQSALKYTDHIVDQKQTKALAKELVTEFGSKASVTDVAEKLSEFYQWIHDQKQPDGEEVTKVSMQIADMLLDDSNATYDQNDIDFYNDFKNTVKKFKVNIDPEVMEAFGDKQSFLDFRRKHMGTMTFVKEGGKSVEKLYENLQENYGEAYFPEQLGKADMMSRIVEAFDTLRPTPILQGKDYYDYTVDVSNRIFEKYFDTAFIPKANGADVRNYIKEYNNAVSEYKKRAEQELLQAKQELANEKAKYAEKAKQNTEEMVAFYNAENKRMMDANRAFQESANRQVNAARSAFKMRADARIKEARAYNDKVSAKKTIIKDVQEMTKWVTNPTDAKHVPESLRKPLADFLSNVDFSSRQTLPDGTETKRTLAWQKMKDALAKIQSNDGIYHAPDGSVKYYDIDIDIIETMSALAQKIEGAKKLDNLSVEDLREMRNVIKAMKKTIQDANRMVASAHGTTVQELSTKSYSQLDSFREHKNFTGALGFIQNLTKNSMLSADTRFHTFGSAAEEVYKELRQGFNVKVQHTQEATEYFEGLKKETGVTEKQLNAWGGTNADTITANIGGKDISLDVSQVMSLYELMKRKQATLHIIDGGEGVVAKRKIKTNGVEKIVEVRTGPMTKEDVARLTDQLTDQQKKFADGIAKFFLTTAKWGNNASMTMYGYNKFNDANYFPIKSDNTALHTDSEGKVKGDQAAVKNAGFTKAPQPNAKNPIKLFDITDVFTDQVNGMSNYDAFLAPLSDLLKWYNYAENGNKTIKHAIERAYGTEANQYIHKLISDINGMQNADGYFANSMVGLMKGAAVGANLSVVVQQPTAIARAAAVMHPKYILQGMNVFKKAEVGDYEHMCKYSGIAQWKDWGFYETDIGKSMKQIVTGTGTWGAISNVQDFKAWLNNAQMKGAEVADKVTWMALWKAAEAQVKAETNLTVGTESYFKEVAKVFDNVIDRTQVVDSIFSRAEVMRNKDSLSKMTTSFMNEPMKSYNSLAWAAFDLTKAIQSKDNAKIKTAGKAAVATTMGFVVSSILASAAKSLVVALRNKDKDKNYGERWLEAFTGETAGNLAPWNFVPYIKDIASIFEGYDIERTDVSAWKELYNATTRIEKMLDGTSQYAPLSDIMAVTKAVGMLTGIGYYNVYRDLNSIVDEYLNALDAQGAIYEKEKILGEDLTSNSTYIKMALKAYSTGKITLGDKIVKELIEVEPADSEKEQTGNEKVIWANKEEKVYEKIKARLKKDQQMADFIARNSSGKLQECALQALTGANKTTIEKMAKKGVTTEDYIDYTTGKKTPQLTDVMDKGYASDTELYHGIGDADQNENWHHIVEQSAGFVDEKVQNTNNIVSIPSGAASVHTLVTMNYNKVYDYTDGKTLREWLEGKSFEEQWKYGVEQLEQYGKLVPGKNCWLFVPNDGETKTEAAKKFEGDVAEARLDGDLTDDEITNIALNMLKDGVSAEEAYELYAGEAKTSKRRENFISDGGKFEDYLKYHSDLEEFSGDTKREDVAEYIKDTGVSEETQKLLWELAGYSVDSTKDGEVIEDGNFNKYFKTQSYNNYEDFYETLNQDLDSYLETTMSNDSISDNEKAANVVQFIRTIDDISINDIENMYENYSMEDENLYRQLMAYAYMQIPEEQRTMTADEFIYHYFEEPDPRSKKRKGLAYKNDRYNITR